MASSAKATFSPTVAALRNDAAVAVQPDPAGVDLAHPVVGQALAPPRPGPAGCPASGRRRWTCPAAAGTGSPAVPATARGRPDRAVAAGRDDQRRRRRPRPHAARPARRRRRLSNSLARSRRRAAASASQRARRAGRAAPEPGLLSSTARRGIGTSRSGASGWCTDDARTRATIRAASSAGADADGAPTRRRSGSARRCAPASRRRRRPAGRTAGAAGGSAPVTPVAKATADAEWPDGNEKVRGSGSSGATSTGGRSRRQANFSGPLTRVAANPMPSSPPAAAVRSRRRRWR